MNQREATQPAKMQRQQGAVKNGGNQFQSKQTDASLPRPEGGFPSWKTHTRPAPPQIFVEMGAGRGESVRHKAWEGWGDVESRSGSRNVFLTRWPNCVAMENALQARAVS